MKSTAKILKIIDIHTTYNEKNKILHSFSVFSFFRIALSYFRLYVFFYIRSSFYRLQFVLHLQHLIAQEGGLVEVQVFGGSQHRAAFLLNGFL